jgi:RimJ/RimL family protein N-acetyltransferase
MILFMARVSNAPATAAPTLSGFEITIWRPSLLSWKPSGLPMVPTVVWSAFHQLRIFSNRDLGMVVIRRGAEVVHHLLVTPRWYRFPFMKPGDVQIGAVYTAPTYRGRGLARLGIATACRVWQAPQRRVWYLVEPENEPSIRAATACGFTLVGTGERTPVAGVGVLGRYDISAYHTEDGT